MVYHILPIFREYWTTNEDLSVPLIAKTIKYGTIATIRRFLQYKTIKINPIDSANRNRSFTICPILQYFNDRFQYAVVSEECMSIDR